MRAQKQSRVEKRPHAPRYYTPRYAHMGVGTQDADDDLKCRGDDFDESDFDDDDGLRCPISRCVFKDPVMIVGSGNTYERKCIETFFEKLRRNGQVLRDPLTNEPLSSSNNNSSQKKASELITNWERRRAVQKYLEKLQHQMLQVSR